MGPVLTILWELIHLCFISIVSPVIGLSIFSFGIFKTFSMICVSFSLHGSTWDCVIIILLKVNKIYNREVKYTLAMTLKNVVVLFCFILK